METQSAPAIDQPLRISWPVVFALFTVGWALRFSYFTLDDLTREHSGTVLRRLIEEGTGAYSAMLLFPIIRAAEQRFPLSSGRWRNWPGHLVALLVFTPLHTALMAVSRWAIFPALGQGAYDYGRMPLRFFMEAPEDAISYATIVCLLTFLRVQRDLREREVSAAMLERDASNARLESLSLRLQPHFLFNALNTISSAVYTNPAAADEMIGKLGDLLRQSLRTSHRQEVTVGEELETLEAYLAFVDARFSDRVHVELHVAPDAGPLALPAFLLQPLVENAVHHGASLECDETNIRIAIDVTPAGLHILVENELGRVPANAPRDGTGLGTTRDRLRLLYGNAARLEAGSDGTHFRVAIDIPAHTLPARRDRETAAEHARAHR